VVDVTNVDPEPTGGTARLLSLLHGHEGVVSPHDRRLQHHGLPQLGQRLRQDRSVPDPVTQGAPSQEHTVSCQDIFESIEREVVGELADDHEDDQAGPGDPSWDGFGWERWAKYPCTILGRRTSWRAKSLSGSDEPRPSGITLDRLRLRVRPKRGGSPLKVKHRPLRQITQPCRRSRAAESRSRSR
jgi:hypothetical protein